jgi:hypothetical protein
MAKHMHTHAVFCFPVLYLSVCLCFSHYKILCSCFSVSEFTCFGVVVFVTYCVLQAHIQPQSLRKEDVQAGGCRFQGLTFISKGGKSQLILALRASAKKHRIPGLS